MPIKIITASDEKQSTDFNKLPKIVKAILACLDALPDDEVISSPVLAGRVGRARGYMTGHTAHAALAKYRYHLTSNNSLLWGNPTAIRALKKEMKRG